MRNEKQRGTESKSERDNQGDTHTETHSEGSEWEKLDDEETHINISVKRERCNVVIKIIFVKPIGDNK